MHSIVSYPLPACCRLPALLRNAGMWLIVLFLIAATERGRAQGDLIPPGPPAPTMKSLQEIWDKVGGLETQVSGLQTQNARAA